MKNLPYFRWYPADAEGDEKYSGLNREELGLFHQCLNKAWLNNGLPSDPAEVGRIMKLTVAELRRLWPRVSSLFYVRESDGRLVNRRQEEERAIALAKSENNKRPRNTNASRSRVIRDPIDSQHAQVRADSDSESKKQKDVPKTEGFDALRLAYHQGNRPTTEKDWVRACEEIINCGISDEEIGRDVVPWVADELSKSNAPRKFYAPCTLFMTDLKPWKVDRVPEKSIYTKTPPMTPEEREQWKPGNCGK